MHRATRTAIVTSEITFVDKKRRELHLELERIQADIGETNRRLREDKAERASPKAKPEPKKIPLKDVPEAGLSGFTIPALIDRIIIGPTRDPFAILEAFADLLAKAGVDRPYNRIPVSNIPLRY